MANETAKRRRNNRLVRSTTAIDRALTRPTLNAARIEFGFELAEGLARQQSKSDFKSDFARRYADAAVQDLAELGLREWRAAMSPLHRRVRRRISSLTPDEVGATAQEETFAAIVAVDVDRLEVAFGALREVSATCEQGESLGEQKLSRALLFAFRLDVGRIAGTQWSPQRLTQFAEQIAAPIRRIAPRS